MQKTRSHILLVDDEESIRDPLTKYLERQGYRVTAAENAVVARQALSAYDIDIVLLDIMMPGEDGLSLCQHISTANGPPVILLTAKSETADRIAGLEIGADDYLAKPFSPRELVARIKITLRRIGANQDSNHPAQGYQFNGWMLDCVEQKLFDPHGVLISLSTGEFRLLEVFLQRPGQILTRDQLLDLTSGREAGPLDRTIDNQISRLRRKIEIDAKEPDYIKTIWGGGYRFSSEVTATAPSKVTGS
jgi:two-component system, OmpR family, response regulator